jgi:hypothetical protein
MRTTKELLEIVLARIDLLQSGLCNLISILHDYGEINIEEHTILKEYFDINQYPSTTWYRPYWWSSGVKEPRIDWLKLHIEKNGNNIK